MSQGAKRSYQAKIRDGALFERPSERGCGFVGRVLLPPSLSHGSIIMMIIMFNTSKKVHVVEWARGREATAPKEWWGYHYSQMMRTQSFAQLYLLYY